MDIAGKLLDILIGAVPLAADRLLPSPLKKEILARLRDANPFNKEISTNHDLVRAVRLAWIEAAMLLLDHVGKASSIAESNAANLEPFSGLLRKLLQTERLLAFTRNKEIERSPIDRHVKAILGGASEYLVSHNDSKPQHEVTTGFLTVLSALTGWREEEIPAAFETAAKQGVIVGHARLDFGELVFASFAELIKSRQRYPEAQEAFHIAMAKAVDDVARATLVAVTGIDSKLDLVLQNAGNARSLWNAGATAYLEAIPQLSKTVDVVLARQQEQLTEQRTQSTLLAQIAEKLGLGGASELTEKLKRLEVELSATRNELIAIVSEISGQGVATEDIDDAIADAKVSLQHTRAELIRLRSLAAQFPQIGPALERAEAALNANENINLAEAQEFVRSARLEYARVLADSQREHNASLAELLEQEAHIAAARSSLLEAAELFAQAAHTVQDQPTYTRGVCYYNAATYLYRFHLRKSGQDLGRVITFYQQSAQTYKEAGYPEEWADALAGIVQTQTRMGMETIGPRGVVRLQNAVSTSDELLAAFNAADAPRKWVEIANDKATALRHLGERYDEADYLVYLRKAQDLVDGIVRVCTQNGFKKELYNALDTKAVVHERIGHALLVIGEREEAQTQVDMGIAACNRVLESLREDGDREGTNFRVTTNSLANLRMQLGKLKGGKEGIAEFEKAFGEYGLVMSFHDRAESPVAWAMYRFNQGLTLTRGAQLGTPESRDFLVRAVEIFSEVANIFPPETFLSGWVGAQAERYSALMGLGEMATSAEEAYSLFRGAADVAIEVLSTISPEVSETRARFQHHLGDARASMMNLCLSKALIEENRLAAVTAYRAAQMFFTNDSDPETFQSLARNILQLDPPPSKYAIVRWWRVFRESVRESYMKGRSREQADPPSQ